VLFALAVTAAVAACSYLYRRLKRLPVETVGRAETIARAGSSAVSSAAHLIGYLADVCHALITPRPAATVGRYPRIDVDEEEDY